MSKKWLHGRNAESALSGFSKIQIKGMSSHGFRQLFVVLGLVHRFLILLYKISRLVEKLITKC